LQPDFLRALNVDAQVESAAQAGFPQKPQTIHEQEFPDCDALRFRSAGMRGKVIARDGNRASFPVFVERFLQKGPLNHPWIVKVQRRAVLSAQVGLVTVKIVLDNPSRSAQLLFKPVGQPGLACATPACDGDDKWFF
jgi:hypothetical protein